MSNLSSVSPGSPAKRDLSIDRYRGVLVMLMVIGNYIAGVQAIPDFLKHAPDVGYTVADIVAPAFVFIIGLNYGNSFLRRYESDKPAAYRYVLTRYLSLIGIGAIISAGSNLVGRASDWGVLQAIGIAGVLCLLFIRLNPWIRLAAGLLLLVGYQVVLDASMLESVLGSNHGGLFGSISWTALLILSTALADMFKRGFPPLAISLGALVVVAAVSMALVPVSKNRVSLSYILVSLLISAVAFLVARYVSRAIADRPGLLSWWGQNALALYMLHLLVLGLFVTPSASWWYEQAELWLVVLQILFILTVLSVAAWALYQRRARKAGV